MNLESELKKFISLKTIAGDELANKVGIEYLTSILEEIGFTCEIEGDSPHFQPVIVAKFSEGITGKKLVLYNHYDVEVIRKEKEWETPPFELVEKGNRLYGRGTADNKSILLSRLFALREMVQKGLDLPNILWIIQGEEEVSGKTPFKVIPKHFSEFGAKLYLEETGYQKRGQILIFYLPNSDPKPKFLEGLNRDVFDGKAKFEYRSMSKFSKCPFVTNIPSDGHYLAFGPNDSLSRIHQPNESIDKTLLAEHIPTFKRFIKWVLENDI